MVASYGAEKAMVRIDMSEYNGMDGRSGLLAAPSPATTGASGCI